MALHLRITAQRSGASDSAVHTLRSPKVIPTSPCHIFPVTKKRDRLELIASADIDSRVREKGVLVIGELLKEKTARKELIFLACFILYIQLQLNRLLKVMQGAGILSLPQHQLKSRSPF
jgi:hypothetical protein